MSAPAASPPVPAAVGRAPSSTRRSAFVPPPLPRRGERRDGMTPLQNRLMVAAIVAAHAAALWGLLQIRAVREAVADAAPMFVSLIAPPAPPEPTPVPKPPPMPTPVQKRAPPPPLPIIAAAPSPTPAPPVFTVPAVVPPEPAPVPAAPPAPPAVVVAAPPPPKIIPASSVQYLEPIVLEYPRLSKRLGETGRVRVRVFIDESGTATQVQVERSSGHSRLDDAAVAAVQKARFKPYAENGRPVAGWAFIPLEFELEK